MNIHEILTPKINGRYGAPMGRPARTGRFDYTISGFVSLVQIKLDVNGYDKGGAYWGLGERLFGWVGPGGDLVGYVRAANREEAKAAVRLSHPRAKFYR